MPLEAREMEALHAAIRDGRRIRIRLDDGRSGRRSARTFIGVPAGIGPWGTSQEPHIMIQMLGAHGTMVGVAVQLERVVAVDTDVL